MKSIIIAALLAASAAPLSGCADPLGPVTPGTLLFEVEYVNHAWGFTWDGYYVDAEGAVWSYSLANPWEHDGQETWTGGELLEKYVQGRSLTRVLSAAEVAERYEAVGAAAAGPLGPRQGRCADAGTIRYHALVYDAEQERYTRVLLYQAGDVAQANHSPAAQALTEWLREIRPAGFHDGSGCAPTNEGI